MAERGRTARLGVTVAAAALALAALAAPGGAVAGEGTPLSPGDVGLSAEVGFGGHALGGSWLPVTVSLSPSRLLAGRVEVVADHRGGRLTLSEPIEVAAGATERHRFVIPPAWDLQVRVVADGADEAIVVRPARHDTDGFLIGVVGEVPDGAPRLHDEAFDVAGTFVPVPPEVLDGSPQVLESLSAVVVTPTVFDDLPPEARRTLTAAAAAGMDLVVAADRPGATPPDLPWLAATPADAAVVDLGAVSGSVIGLAPAEGAVTLTPDEVVDGGGDVVVAAAVPAGLGRSLTVGLPLGGDGLGRDATLWSAILSPTRSIGLEPGVTDLDLAAGWPIEEVLTQGLAGGDAALPGLVGLAIFLVVYVLVVGPGNALLLRRLGRRELAWVTVPAITVVAAAAAYVVSSGSQPAVALAARAAWWADGSGTEVVAAAVRDPRPGDHTVTLPGDGWTVQPLAGGPATIVHGDDEVALTLRLQALQPGPLVARRSTDLAAPLDVVSTVEGSELTVEVTNVSGLPIADVVVRLATFQERLGDLAPGASETVAVTLPATLPTRDPWSDGELMGVGRGAAGRIDATRAMRVLLESGPLAGNPGHVWVSGSVDGPLALTTPSIAGGIEQRGTLVVVGSRPIVTGADAPVFVVPRSAVFDTDQGLNRPGPLAVEGVGDAVLRYRLPTDAPTGMRLSLDRGMPIPGQGIDGGQGAIPVPEITCETVEHRDEEGNLLGVEETCTQLDAPGPIDVGALGGFEIRDHRGGVWVPVSEVMEEDGTVAAPADFVGPLGEVLLRVRGELFPFDFSGRGVSITREAAA